MVGTAQIEALRRIAGALEKSGLSYSLGGSGLLNALRLTRDVRDWDIMSDEPPEAVADALEAAGIVCRALPGGGGIFATEYRLEAPQLQADIIGRFAIRGDNGICRLPADVFVRHNGVNLAYPEVWAAAYTLMGRDAKADLLFGYLDSHGGSKRILDRLSDNPLPEKLRRRLSRIMH